MEQPEFTQGANALTNTLHSMIKGIAEPPVVLDFGVINSDYSISTNLFPNPIPKSEYSVCRSLLYDPRVPLTETYIDGKHGHPDASPPGLHFHEVKLPKKMYHLRPGDRVLVGWIQNEAVVIDIVYSAKHLPGEPPWK